MLKYWCHNFHINPQHLLQFCQQGEVVSDQTFQNVRAFDASEQNKAGPSPDLEALKFVKCTVR